MVRVLMRPVLSVIVVAGFVAQAAAQATGKPPATYNRQEREAVGGQPRLSRQSVGAVLFSGVVPGGGRKADVHEARTAFDRRLHSAVAAPCVGRRA